LTHEQLSLLDFTSRLIAFRQQHPVLRRRKFFQGRPIRGAEVKDLAWFDPQGREMTDDMWNAHHIRFLGVRLAGDVVDELDERGEALMDDTLLLLLNADEATVPFALPASRAKGCWAVIFDTAIKDPAPRCIQSGEQYPLKGQSLAVLQWSPQERREGSTRGSR
jgi:glycogen operon protein